MIQAMAMAVLSASMSFDERAAVRRTPTSLRVFHEFSGVGIANVMVISVLGWAFGFIMLTKDRLEEDAEADANSHHDFDGSQGALLVAAELSSAKTHDVFPFLYDNLTLHIQAHVVKRA